MASVTYSIPVNSWTITGSYLTPNSVCNVTIEAPSPTAQSSIPVTVSFSGRLSISQAATNHFSYIWFTIFVKNTTTNKTYLVMPTFNLPQLSDTTTPVQISVTKASAAFDLNSGSNSFQVTSISAVLYDERDVQYSNIGYSSFPSTSMTVVRATNTGTPTNVSVSPSSVSAAQTVTISWSAASNGTNNPVTGYTVYYSDDGGTTWKNFASVGSTIRSQVVAGPAASGATRLYFVRADAAYNTEPRNSSIVSCGWISSGVTDPSNLTINKDMASLNDTVTLTWTGSTIIGTGTDLQYLVYYSVDGGTTWTQNGSTTSTTINKSLTTSASGVSAVGDVVLYKIRARAKINNVWTYAKQYTNTVSCTIANVYTCYSTASKGYYWTNNSVAIGTKSDSDGNLTLLSQYDYTENSSMQMQAQAYINTTSLRMRKSPGFATSGTNWDANVWKVGSATVYLNKPEQYICYGGSGGNSNDDGKMIYVTTPNAGTLNKLAFAYASDGGYITGGNISYGNNRSVFRLSSGLTVVIKRLPFGCNASSVGGSSIQIGNWFADNSSFTAVPIVIYSIQHTYDGYAAMPRLYFGATASAGGELYIGAWQANDTTSANRSQNLAGIATVIAIGKKA